MNTKKNKLKYNYIYVIYDIKEERVNKIFKTCKKYLEHYQNSVFRGELSESNILKLKNEINKIIDKNEDSVLILFSVSKNSLKTEELGTKTGNSNFL